MQIKTIEKTIKAKMNEWLNTISDKKLKDDVKDNLLVTGGSIASMLLNEPVNDYDIYLMDIDVLKRLTEYYAKDFPNDLIIFDGREKDKLVEKYNVESVNHNIDYAENIYAVSLRNLKDTQIKLFINNGSGYNVTAKEGATIIPYSPAYFSPNAITLTDNIQIVLRFWGNATEIHKTFDFTHATNYFTFKDGLVRNLGAMESIITKQLKYQGSEYPLTSIIRAKKFIKRGWNINAGELLKIMFQISKLDLENFDVLEEQLIGVDVAYFGILIEILRSDLKNDKIDKSVPVYVYVSNLIDTVFNATDEII